MPSLKKAYGRLAQLALDQMRTLRAAERDGDEELCRSVWRRDRLVDSAYADAFREAVHMLSLTPQTSFLVVDVLFCAKNLERVSDHVRTIADMIHFAKSGQHLGLGRDEPGRESQASAA
jgi:phosphate transport system protein